MLRVPNLLIIALTFFLLRYLVFVPVYDFYGVVHDKGSLYFLVMVFTTVLIAASGYISNDYFDIVTDKVNKPEKQYIGTHVSPGSALTIAILFSILAISGSLWLCIILKSAIPGILLFTALIAAWWYAIQLKKSFIWGNIAVSCMSAGTIAMAWVIEKQNLIVPSKPSGIITLIIVAVSIFAFLLSVMREIVKDLEDMEGDRLINCRSLPIVKGVSTTKHVLILIEIILLGMLIITQIFLANFSAYLSILWLLAGVEIPLVYFSVLLKRATTKISFHQLSSFLKYIMLGGLLTLLAGQF